MLFKEKLKRLSAKEIWQEYCGFLDLSMSEYMAIQRRLLEEQISVFSKSRLGKAIIKTDAPISYDDFRKMVPLTTYDDYAPYLLGQTAEVLPSDPVAWLETTWEGGSRPKKVAPYSREMLDIYTNNIIAAMILSTSMEKGSFSVRNGDRALFGLAPMPYATGLFPLLIAPEMDIRFMPSQKEAEHLSFREQSTRGFSIAMKSGMDQFFGMSGIIYTITQRFQEYASSGNVSLKSLVGIKPSRLFRLLRAKYLCSRDNRPLQPKDIFSLKGFVCVGTDTALYKNDLEQAWGRRPLEIHGGTETGCLATETWGRNGLVFFPDNAFYEFIPKSEMLRGEADPNYTPKTYLMDEVCANEEYELVLTMFKGGAFMRYRPGDMYRCLCTADEREGIKMPKFEYIDRVPWVIDIAGFTRITENSINHVLKVANLKIENWFARKEYDNDKRSYMHFYAELPLDDAQSHFLTEEVIRDHFSTYFRQYDHDYKDLKKMLGIEPLTVTILPHGIMNAFEMVYGHKIRPINTPNSDITDLNYLIKEQKPSGGSGYLS
ncbi:MAG: GH3 auxin-responsive promoter family protein [Lachnospiraceae bacterium]|nr:GH3 auxin-responsive promoter family protein [Candidatus Equihabitans merdae]